MSSLPAASLADRLDALLASDPEAMADPFALYRDLREQAPVLRHGQAVVVSRYVDVRDVISDGVRYSNHASRDGSRARAIRARLAPEHQRVFDKVADLESMSVARSDGEQHARLRAVAHRAFTPRRVEAMRPRIVQTARELVDGFRDHGVVDAMELAYRLPMAVIAGLLGIPEEEREAVHAWSLRIARNRGGSELDALLDAQVAHGELRAYVGDLVTRHRRRPGEGGDLVAALLGAEGEARISTDELTAMFVVLVVAGHETTTNLIGIGLYELLRERDAWEALVRVPALLENAVEELLRFVSPAHWLPRQTVVDLAIGAVEIAAGTTVIPLLGAANRDPAAFASPEALDLARPDARRHLALGWGRHFCLGASLARLEASVALREVSMRFPDVELASDRVEWTGNAVLRRLAALRVAPGRERSAA